jgi:hypothetical protein
MEKGFYLSLFLTEVINKVGDIFWIVNLEFVPLNNSGLCNSYQMLKSSFHSNLGIYQNRPPSHK